MKKPEKKVATKKPGTALSTVDDNELMKYAVRETEREKPRVGSTLSLEGLRFSFKGSDLGKEVELVILDYRFINALYDGPYRKDTPSTPGCFAIAEDSTSLTADPSSPNPFGGGEAAESCEGCWANQWASDLKGGKGKACKNTRRLAVFHRDYLDGGLEGETPIVTLSVPPTSTGAWSAYVNKLATVLKKPQFAFVTKISFDQDFDYAKLKFEAVEPINDRAALAKIIQIRTDIQSMLEAPFDPEGYVKPEPVKRGAAVKPGANKTGKGRSKFS